MKKHAMMDGEEERWMGKRRDGWSKRDGMGGVKSRYG
jgi:hypothetical protein